METDPVFSRHQGTFILKPRLVWAMLCLVLGAAMAGAEALPAFPVGIKPLIEAHKYEEASQKLYEMIAAESGVARLPLIALVYDIDPQISRLETALAGWLDAETDSNNRTWLAKNLGNLRLLKRDFLGAAAAFDRGGPIAELQLKAGGVYLLLGDLQGAEQRLTQASKDQDPLIADAAVCALAWKQWADGQALAGYKLLNKRKSANALGLQCLLAQSLGMKKEAQLARTSLQSGYPNSVIYSLVDGDSDPAVQMDTALLVLLGIGPTIPGSSAQSGSDPTPAPANETAAKNIQVGIFKDKAHAKKLADSLKAKGFPTQIDEEKANGVRYKVLVLLKKGQDPQTVLVKLKDAGIEGFLNF